RLKHDTPVERSEIPMPVPINGIGISLRSTGVSCLRRGSPKAKRGLLTEGNEGHEGESEGKRLSAGGAAVKSKGRFPRHTRNTRKAACCLRTRNLHEFARFLDIARRSSG